MHSGSKLLAWKARACRACLYLGWLGTSSLRGLEYHRKRRLLRESCLTKLCHIQSSKVESSGITRFMLSSFQSSRSEFDTKHDVITTQPFLDRQGLRLLYISCRRSKHSRSPKIKLFKSRGHFRNHRAETGTSAASSETCLLHLTKLPLRTLYCDRYHLVEGF